MSGVHDYIYRDDELDRLRADNARLVGEVAEARNLVGILRGSIHTHKDALGKARVALSAYANACTSVEVFIALGGKPTKGLKQAGQLHKDALATINEVLGEK